MGVEGAQACLRAGANDLGGTLMNESISRAAGAPTARNCRRRAWMRSSCRSAADAEQRTTLYRRAPEEQQRASYACAPLSPVTQTPATRHARLGGRHSAASA